MNKTNAISILSRQRDKLKDLELPGDLSFDWLVQTRTYIDNFFGEESHQSGRLKRIPLGSVNSPNLIPFLNDCIETIKDIDLHKKPKSNYLVSMPNWAASLLLMLIFTVGLALGELKLISSVFNNKNPDSSNTITLNKPRPISNPKSNLSQPLVY